jgi:hypothetical protein
VQVQKPVDTRELQSIVRRLLTSAR